MLTTSAISPPVDAGSYASILTAFGGEGAATGLVLIGHPEQDGTFTAECRPFADSPHQGWKARYDRDRNCAEVISEPG